ncbi:hypothetical protein WH47_07017 [Habropoda laboriosa]|uniref:Uncharacterized protein n=1 Tax=Habropoda laboriosa TaxID=597456 RepID=A0A0L7RFP8_9HYME|nr:hypothetical protein WH47_07017 [Habropoda laboriosa]
MQLQEIVGLNVNDSPDLTSLDFFLWAKLKEVYQQRPATPENMKNRIISVYAAIRPETIERAAQSVDCPLQKVYRCRWISL